MAIVTAPNINIEPKPAHVYAVPVVHEIPPRPLQALSGW